MSLPSERTEPSAADFRCGVDSPANSELTIVDRAEKMAKALSAVNNYGHLSVKIRKDDGVGAFPIRGYAPSPCYSPGLAQLSSFDELFGLYDSYPAEAGTS